MDIGFLIRASWYDNDVRELQVTAWNGSFGGSSAVYVEIGKLGEIAENLRGFPNSIGDTREVQLGAFGPKIAGGGVTLRFYCVDGAGHTFVESRIESGHESGGVVQYVKLSMPFEPSAVDSFLDGLRTLETNRPGVAQLKGVPTS